jgi:hypothetical protein
MDDENRIGSEAENHGREGPKAALKVGSGAIKTRPSAHVVNARARRDP